MEKFEVVPDAIDTIPESVLNVKFGKLEVNLGNVLTPTAVKDEPTVTWDADANRFYTLVMIDLDAPSRANPSYRSVQHWLVVNIPGQNVAEGQTMTEFLSSAPGRNDGVHRYVFLVYEQDGRQLFEESVLGQKSIQERKSFSIRAFSQKYNLGNPLALNFYQAEWDDFVTDLRKERGLPP